MKKKGNYLTGQKGGDLKVTQRNIQNAALNVDLFQSILFALIV